MKLNNIYWFDDGETNDKKFKGFVILNEESINLLELKIKQIRNEFEIIRRNEGFLDNP